VRFNGISNSVLLHANTQCPGVVATLTMHKVLAECKLCIDLIKYPDN